MNSKQQPDTPKGWEQFNTMLVNLPKEPLPAGYHNRMNARLAQISDVPRKVFRWEWIGGVSLSAIAAMFILVLNSILPSTPASIPTTTKTASTKALPQRNRTPRHTAQRRIPAANPVPVTDVQIDTMPPASLEQQYQNPAVTGGTTLREDYVQHDAEPGIPAQMK